MLLETSIERIMIGDLYAIEVRGKIVLAKIGAIGEKKEKNVLKPIQQLWYDCPCYIIISFSLWT